MQKSVGYLPCDRLFVVTNIKLSPDVIPLYFVFLILHRAWSRLETTFLVVGYFA